MIALLKSGPGATHTAMIDHHFNSDEGISKLVKVRLGIDLFILNKTFLLCFNMLLWCMMDCKRLQVKPIAYD